MSQFDRIKAYYRTYEREILDAGANGWGLDPYQWDFEAHIKLTPIEDQFWFDIRHAGVVLYPQYPVGRYFVDFANPAAKVAIECDGFAYHQDKERDALRQREIESLGWAVYRLTGRECYDPEIEAYDEDGRQIVTEPAGVALLREINARHYIGIGVPA